MRQPLGGAATGVAACWNQRRHMLEPLRRDAGTSECAELRWATLRLLFAAIGIFSLLGPMSFFLLEPAIRCAGTGHDFFVVTGAYAFLLQSGHFLLDLAIRGAGTGP